LIRTTLVPLGFALLATACGSLGPSSPGTQGELGNGQFSYGCDSDSDPVCDGGSGTHPMPKSVAVGGRFSVSYTPSSTSENNQGSAIVEPASEELLVQTESFGSTFKAVKPGLAGLLARRGQTLVDLIHVRLATIDHVQVDRVDTPAEKISDVELAVGESAQIRGTAVDAADEMLAGALTCAWSVADEKIAAATTLTTDNSITIEGKAVGKTTLHLDMGDMKADLSVSIVAGTGGAGGEGGSGAGGGAGGATAGAGGAGGGV